MTELQRDLHVLVAIAKLDAALNRCKTELAQLPAKIDKIDKDVAAIVASEKDLAQSLESMSKERRTLERELEDHAAQVARFKTQLMEVKTNKEYTAMLHEIEHIEKEIDRKEERLLLLMDELDTQQSHHDQSAQQSGERKSALEAEKKQLEDQVKSLQQEAKTLEEEKPKLLADLDPALRRRYDRIIAKLHDFAVTHLVGEVCQGCFTRIPPQTALEVRRNDQIITCQGCGRILVHYES